MASSAWLDMIVAGVLGDNPVTTVQSPLSVDEESMWLPASPHAHVAVFAQLISTFCLLTHTVLIRPWRRQPAIQLVRPFGRSRLFEIALQICIAAYCVRGLILLQQRAESRVQTHITLLLSTSCLGALSNVVGLLLGQPSTARGVYHLLGSLTWAFFDSSSLPRPPLPLDWLFPWILAATSLLDVFHAGPGSSRPKGTTVPSSSTQSSSLVEKLSYSWLGRIIQVQDVLRLDDLPENPALAPSEEYEARLVEAAAACSSPDKAATNLYWRFIAREHRRQLVVSTLLRLACDASLFAIPWQLQRLLTRPTAASVMAMFCSRVLGALAGNFSGYHLRRLAVQYRSALSSALHRKTLRLGDFSPAGDDAPVADLSTLAEVDTLVLFRSAQSFPDVWNMPVQVALCLGGLAVLLPYPAFIAILVLIAIMFPVLSLLLRSMAVWISSNLAAKDARAKLLAEVLESIQGIKMHAWEPVFVRSIAERRARELETLRNAAVSASGLVAYMQTMPSALTLAAFGVVLLMRRPLTNELVFAAIMLFTMLNATLGQISSLASTVQSVHASSKRIQAYLSLSETKIAAAGRGLLTQTSTTRSWSPDMPILSHDDLEVGWPDAAAPLIRNGSLSIGPGELTIITGAMGCGKSTLLLFLCRHMERARRRHSSHPKIAYVGQKPVLVRGSIRDNILFGRPYDAQRYAQSVRACCLHVDFARLHDGDGTVIAGSSALSGGQCARICLARAAYSRADVYLLDTPLAALDVRVASHITHHLLGPGGLLDGSTRVVCTSHALLVRKADSLYEIAGGTIRNALGNGHVQLVDGAEEPTNAALEADMGEANMSDTLTSLTKPILTDLGLAQMPLVRVAEAEVVAHEPIPDTPQPIIIHEKPPAPSAQNSPLLAYLSSARRFGWPIAISILLLARASSVMGTYVLKIMAARVDRVTLLPWDLLLLFAVFSASQAALFFLFVHLLYRLCIVPAASALHGRLTSGVLLRDLSFFQATPPGRLLNLFTNDVARVDGSLNASIASLAGQFVNLALSCGVLVAAMPASVLFVAPLLAACYALQQTYLAKLRELRHLDAESRAPLLDHLQEAERGRVLFSAHGVLEARAAAFGDLVARNVRALWPLSCIDLWLGVRLEVLSVVLQVAALGLLLAGAAEPGVLGFVMTYVFQVTGTLSNIAKISAQFEADAVSVARIAEYSFAVAVDGKEDGFPADRDGSTPYSDSDPAPAWPQFGRVEFRGVSASYQPSLPDSLQSVSFTVKPGEKVAVVGRTGAGKSSMVMCLLRLMHQTAGETLIDGVDIADVTTVRLRRSLALMPQTQIVFSGSIRQNLDPLGLHHDEEILDALGVCGGPAITDKLSGIKDSEEIPLLDTIVGPNINLSKGELQLLLLSRAVLQKSTILILDEATSGMDAEAEARCHDIICENLRDTTTLAILHRLDLTLRYDKVLVLERGRVVAFDTPAALLAQGQGPYFCMVQEDPTLMARAKHLFGLE
ncbi:Putative AAA+ ATPase domain, ABC transporter type 1, transmembrane domain-containing protein [Colletotrichum destructivum]|uniref:AAA+ ATPase domain, ABC transporter type 1, transmembrane domain-containing protein n=1 Tax=Colletotrichum destructivum TaxID=34406 RepID=A0AAX4IS56_9PEZI|nr:Putative AAA+ ATPase domain, ABC transporter type 1, transmembrane domain-containing protein [Colletotrichum destructivum]